MTSTTILGETPSVATDITITSPTLKGALAHRRVMTDVVIGVIHHPAKKVGDLDFPAHDEELKVYVQTAACTGAKATPVSWGWARHNGARLCPDCWEDVPADDGPPAFTLEHEELTAAGTIADKSPTVADVVDNALVQRTLEDAANVGAIVSEPPMWDEEWGAMEPPDDEYVPPVEWEPPVRNWRPVERGPELP